MKSESRDSLRTFRASSLSAALRKISEELGPDATILSTERKQQGILSRLLGRGCIEVVAQADGVLAPPAASSAIDRTAVVPATETAGESAKSDRGGGTQNNPARRVSADAGPPNYRQRLREFAEQEQPVSLLEGMLPKQRHGAPAQLPATLFSVYIDLLDAEVAESLVRDTVGAMRTQLAERQLSDVLAVRNAVTQYLARQIQVSTPPCGRVDGQQQVIAVVGPTGSGKTTALAKLAVQLRMHHQTRVGLISADTYRLAAAEQLQAYAQLIDAPFAAVETPLAMQDAIRSMQDADVVLIDTAGRSPRLTSSLHDLQGMLDAARAQHRYLVLSAASRHLQRSVAGFEMVQPTGTVITRLDEVEQLGHLLSVVRNPDMPLVFGTQGQRVPDDMLVIEPARLVERILPVAR